MKNCNKCNALLPDEARFCAVCGAKYEEPAAVAEPEPVAVPQAEPVTVPETEPVTVPPTEPVAAEPQAPVAEPAYVPPVYTQPPTPQPVYPAYTYAPFVQQPYTLAQPNTVVRAVMSVFKSKAMLFAAIAFAVAVIANILTGIFFAISSTEYSIESSVEYYFLEIFSETVVESDIYDVFDSSDVLITLFTAIKAVVWIPMIFAVIGLFVTFGSASKKSGTMSTAGLSLVKASAVMGMIISGIIVFTSVALLGAIVSEDYEDIQWCYSIALSYLLDGIVYLAVYFICHIKIVTSANAVKGSILTGNITHKVSVVMGGTLLIAAFACVYDFVSSITEYINYILRMDAFDIEFADLEIEESTMIYQHLTESIAYAGLAIGLILMAVVVFKYRTKMQELLIKKASGEEL